METVKILYSPQKNDKDILYKFEVDKITAYYEGQSDTFNFRGLTDGVAKNIESDLPFNPIISAKRKCGILYVELRYHYKKGATREEKFPVWTDHEYVRVGLYG